MKKTTSMDDFIKMCNEPEKLVGKIPGTVNQIKEAIEFFNGKPEDINQLRKQILMKLKEGVDLDLEEEEKTRKFRPY